MSDQERDDEARHRTARRMRQDAQQMRDDAARATANIVHQQEKAGEAADFNAELTRTAEQLFEESRRLREQAERLRERAEAIRRAVKAREQKRHN